MAKRVLVRWAAGIGLSRLSPAMAGDFIQFSPLQIYVICLGLSLPGIFLSIPVLWLALRRRPVVFAIMVMLWSSVLPLSLGWLVDTTHVVESDSGLWWLPGVIILPLFAGLAWLIPGRSAR